MRAGNAKQVRPITLTSVPARMHKPSPGRPYSCARRRSDKERWSLAVGLALSALIHLLILISSSFMIVIDLPGPRLAPRVTGPQETIRLVAITQVMKVAPSTEDPMARNSAGAHAPAAAPVAKQDERVSPDLALPEQRSAPAAPDPAVDANRGTSYVADRLRPGGRDPRLWSVPNKLSDAEKSDVERSIADRLRAIEDSVLAVQDNSRRTVDWTLGGTEGNRWGISPDCIHVGGLTIPLAVRIGQPKCQSDPMADHTREWNSQKAQADLARARDHLKEQAKAIRERKDQERAKKKGGTM